MKASLRCLPIAFAACHIVACGGKPGSGTGSSLQPTVSGWPMYGHDTARTNYNRGDTSIGVESVGSLEPRFRTLIGVGDLPSSSGPVIDRGRVYVGSSVGSGPNYFCIDAATGAILWSTDVGHASFPGNVGIGSTAAVVDGVVYVGGGDPAFYALDAQTGALRWRHPMDAAPDAYAWSSPLVSGGVVYVGMSARYKALRSEIRALDAATGAVRARQFLVPEDEVGADLWNSLTLGPDGARVFAASGNDLEYDGDYTRALIAFDPVSLAFLDWHQEAVKEEDLDFGTTPVAFHDASGRNLVGANEKNGRFYAYEQGALRNGPVWVRPTGVNVGTMPAYADDVGAGGTVFIVGDNGLLFGVDPASGADRWPPVAAGFANGNVAVANGLLYMGGGAGDVAVVAADSGTLLRILHPQANARTFSGVVVSGGLVYSVAGPYLNAWSATGSGGTPAANTSPRAQVSFAIQPNPPVAAAGTTAAHSAHWRVVLTESAGVGASVNYLSLTFRDAASGTSARPTANMTLDAAALEARAGTSKVPANGSLSFDVDLEYGLVSGRRALSVTGAAQLTDDNSHFVTCTGQALIR